VVVAAWNTRGSDRARRLDSISAQAAAARGRCSVVDDASSDTTADVVGDWIARHDLPVTLLINAENLGAAETRKRWSTAGDGTRFAAFLDLGLMRGLPERA